MSCMEPRERQAQAKSCTSIAKISTKNQNRRKAMSELQKIRIRMKAYDHALLDKYAAKIVETVKKTGADVSGPIPLPTEKEVVTIIRAVHKYKDSREQFEQRTHKRLIDVTNATNKTVEALQKLDAPAGVDIYVKLESVLVRSHERDAGPKHRQSQTGVIRCKNRRKTYENIAGKEDRHDSDLRRRRNSHPGNCR